MATLREMENIHYTFHEQKVTAWNDLVLYQLKQTNFQDASGYFSAYRMIIIRTNKIMASFETCIYLGSTFNYPSTKIYWMSLFAICSLIHMCYPSRFHWTPYASCVALCISEACCEMLFIIFINNNNNHERRHSNGVQCQWEHAHTHTNITFPHSNPNMMYYDARKREMNKIFISINTPIGFTHRINNMKKMWYAGNRSRALDWEGKKNALYSFHIFSLVSFNCRYLSNYVEW